MYCCKILSENHFYRTYSRKRMLWLLTNIKNMIDDGTWLLNFPIDPFLQNVFDLIFNFKHEYEHFKINQE